MTKFSKILLIICLTIFCVCGMIEFTYCSFEVPKNYFSIRLFESIDYNNKFLYYNSNNSKYIKLSNFKLFKKLGLCTFYCNDFVVSDKSFVETYDFGSFVDSKGNYQKLGVVSESWSLTRNLNGLYTYKLNDLTFARDSDVFYPGVDYTSNSGSSIDLSLSFLPNDLFNTFSGQTLLSLWHNFSFGVSYDIDYSNMYFYNQYFALPCEFGLFDYAGDKNSNLFYDYLQYKFADVDTKYTISLQDNNGCLFKNSFNYNFNNNLSDKSKKSYLIFKNNYNYNNSYITSVSFNVDPNNFGGGIFKVPSNNLLKQFKFSKNGVFNSDFPFIFYQSYNDDNSYNNSSLVPIGSNDYYKQCEWYDIPTHLYNFFIYLIFDAPIISNFTKLAMVIINFLVETFNFVIGLFDGVSNVFFISIFVGMLALIFLLKIIFGGKT